MGTMSSVNTNLTPANLPTPLWINQYVNHVPFPYYNLAKWEVSRLFDFTQGEPASLMGARAANLEMNSMKAYHSKAKVIL